MADLRAEHVDALARMLETTFYADAGMMRDAVRHCSNFNLLDLATGFKVDVFIRKDHPFDQSAMARRMAVDVPMVPQTKLMVYSPEDVILSKLEWARASRSAVSAGSSSKLPRSTCMR